jgi:ectoine hydroxylase-related dioxygenase (phytanoyl-CoA dioxygenase family)
MPSVDLRPRTADEIGPVDPEAFFTEQLPTLIAERGDLAVPGARELGVRSFAFVVDESAWTVSFDGDRFTVVPGADGAAAVVRLDAETFADVVWDVLTPMGLFTSGSLDMPAGRLEDFMDWWVILRSLFDGRPVHTTGAVTFDVDLGQSFTLDDDAEDQGHFLAEAGFLHLRNVFSEDEMAAVSAEMDAAADTYAPGDERSWWARTGDGDNRLVRMQWFHEHSPTTAALLADDRLLHVGRLTDDGHLLGKAGGNENLIEALVKPIGIVEGISDVPWHKDCSLGSHSYRCCSLTVGISVTGADAESGQLRVVAGSHRALIQPAFVRKGLDLPQLDLPTETGDVTVHCSCTLHMSQPPVTRERRVMYTDFRLPNRPGEVDPGEAKIRRIREAAPTTVSQEPSPVQ